MLKKVFGLLILLALLMPVQSQAAFNVYSRSTIIIDKEETVDGNMYFAGENLIINGRVKGDLIGLASNIDINGQIDGDVIAVSQKANINGTIGGSVRVLSNILNINSSIDRNLQALASNIYLDPENKVAWDVLMLAPVMDINGLIGGNLQLWSPQVNLKALINKSFYLGKISNEKYLLNINEGTEIASNVYYHSLVKANIAEDVIIGGSIEIREIEKKQLNYVSWLFKTLRNILAAILLALILLHFWKKPIKLINQIVAKKPLSSLGWGTLVIILSPVILLLIALTIIGLPIAIVGASVWLILVIISKLIVAIALGRFIFNQKLKKPKTKTVYKLSVGVIISWLIFSLPIIGPFIAFVATLIGAGAIALYLKKVI